MNCTDFLAKLTDYFDGEIDPDLMKEVQQHLGQCHHCEVVVNTCRKTIDVYRGNDLYEFPPELSDRLRNAVMERCMQVGYKPAFVQQAIDAHHKLEGQQQYAGDAVPSKTKS